MIDTQWMEKKKNRVNDLLSEIHSICDEVAHEGGSTKIYYRNGIQDRDASFIVIGTRNRDANADILGATIRVEVE